MARKLLHLTFGVVAALVGSVAAAQRAPATPVVPPSLLAAARGEDRVDCLVVLCVEEAGEPVGTARAATAALAADTLERSWGALGLDVRRRFEELPVLSVSIPARLLPSLAADPLVAGLSPNRLARTMRREGKSLMKVGDVQSRGFRGRGVGIAILDTGVDYGHDELKPGGISASAKTVKLFDAVEPDGDPRDEQGHGTGVAGIAAGSEGGVAPAATVVAVRVLDGDGEGTSEQILAGLDAVLASVRAGNPFNIRVLNMSLGGYDEDWPPHSGTCDAIDPAFATAFQALTDAGVLMAVASGNGGCELGVSWPACLSAALAVGAVYDDEICTLPAPWPLDCASHSMTFGEGQCMSSGCEQDTKKDRITCYTDSGDKLGVFAPSDCAKTTKKGGGYEDCFNGTSAATPYVAGVAALLAQAYPYLGATAIRAALERTGTPRTDGRNGVTRNRVDALAALTYLASYCPAPGAPQGLAPSSAGTCEAADYTLSWGAGSGAESYRVQRSRTPAFASPEEFTTNATTLDASFSDDAAVTLYHRVRAEKACGAYSAWSGPASVSYSPKCARQPRRRLGDTR